MIDILKPGMMTFINGVLCTSLISGSVAQSNILYYFPPSTGWQIQDSVPINEEVTIGAGSINIQKLIPDSRGAAEHYVYKNYSTPASYKTTENTILKASISGKLYGGEIEIYIQTDPTGVIDSIFHTISSVGPFNLSLVGGTTPIPDTSFNQVKFYIYSSDVPDHNATYSVDFTSITVENAVQG